MPRRRAAARLRGWGALGCLPGQLRGLVDCALECSARRRPCRQDGASMYAGVLGAGVLGVGVLDCHGCEYTLGRSGDGVAVAYVFFWFSRWISGVSRRSLGISS